MKLKSFSQFVNEKQTDPELAKKAQDDVEKEGETCPRCGKLPGVCICVDRDYGSTVNLNRLGKGEKHKNESDFKKASANESVSEGTNKVENTWNSMSSKDREKALDTFDISAPKWIDKEWKEVPKSLQVHFEKWCKDNKH
jgi:hypothetical protein